MDFQVYPVECLCLWNIAATLIKLGN